MSRDDSTTPRSIRRDFVPIEGACERHGAYTAMAWPGLKAECPRCRDERVETSQRELREQQAKEAHALTLTAMNLRGRFRTATFDNFEASTAEQRAVAKACRDFADRFSRTQADGLWLLGPPGTGKSHLGAAIAQAVRFQRDAGVMVMTAREVVRALRDTWRSGSEQSESELIDELGSVCLMVLDEVGVGFGSEAEITQLFDVIDRRYQLRRPTVLLSNLSPSMLKATLGERLYDRLRDGVTVLACDWPSHRTPKVARGGE
jgi:DNA replication protein DnaC